jgi:hypothetical protein
MCIKTGSGPGKQYFDIFGPFSFREKVLNILTTTSTSIISMSVWGGIDYDEANLATNLFHLYALYFQNRQIR